MRHLKVITLLAAFVLIVGSNTEALLIDQFDDYQYLSRSTAGTSSSSLTDGDLPPIIGGERDMSLTLISGFSAELSADLGGMNVLSLSIGTLSKGSAMIQYDGADGSPILDPTGLGGVDLTESGVNSGIRLEIIGTDIPITNGLELMIYTNAVTWSRWAVDLPGLIPPNPTLPLFLPFSSPTSTSGGGADFTDVGAITVFFNTGSATAPDVTIDFIESTIPPGAVPEPTTLLLLGAGIVGIYIVGRRRV